MIGDRANNPGAAPAVFNKPVLRKAQDETPSASPVLVALPAIAAAIVTCLGFVVLLGWLFDIWISKSIFRELEAMKPISAVGFILSGTVLYLRVRGAQIPARRHMLLALAVLVLSLGIVSIIRLSFGTNLYVGNFLIVDGWVADATKSMSVIAGLEFALFGAAMLVSQRNDLAFVALTFVGMLISLLAFTGYLYDLPILYAPMGASPISLDACVAFFVLYVGAAMTRPNTGWAALLAPGSITGAFAPWLLPGIVILPIGLGWVLVQGIRNSTIRAEVGVELFALSGLFLILVAWRTGVIANRLGRHLELREQLEARLREARASAEEAAAAKSDFLANMTHELRTPLNSIIGFAGLLAKSSSLKSKDRRYVEIIDGSSQSLLALVNDILDLSSLESSGVVLHPTPFSLPQLIESVVASFSLISQEKGLTLKIERGNMVGVAHFGDEMRIRQVLVNLVNNAVKFTSKGGVTIAVSASEHSDSVQHLRIEVRDTGIGIAPVKLETLFGRFAQADASIHSRFGGTGLGLAISKRLIQLMGGTIGVDSVEGNGTTLWITLTLPCVDPSALVERAPATGKSPTDGRHILVVDDVDLNRELVTALLAPHGHTIHQAADGAEAVSAVALIDYDLVLMDVQMPGMDGLTATRAIRAIDRLAKLPIVAMTAQALPSQITACHEAGMDDYLAKPITKTALFAAIDKWTADGRPPREEWPETDPSMSGLREEFMAQCARDLARVKSLLASGSPAAKKELQALVHCFAGTADMLGVREVGREARELNAAFSCGEVSESADYMQLIEKLETSLKAA